MTRKKEKRRGPQSSLIFSACYLTRSPPSERQALQSKRPEEASTTAHRQLMGLHWLGFFTRMGPHIFGIWGIRKFRLVGILKWEDIYFMNFNQCVNSFQYEIVKRVYKAKSRYINRKLLSWDRENYIFPKVTKMGSILIWLQNRLWWGRGTERPAAHTQQKLTQVTALGV